MASSTMRNLALAFICLACAGHGTQAQTLVQTAHLPSSSECQNAENCEDTSKELVKLLQHRVKVDKEIAYPSTPKTDIDPLEDEPSVYGHMADKHMEDVPPEDEHMEDDSTESESAHMTKKQIRSPLKDGALLLMEKTHTMHASIAPYKGSTLVSATPISHKQVETIKDLVMGQLGIDAWTERIGLHLPAHLMIPNGTLPAVENAIRDAGMEPELLITDIAEKLQHEHDANQMQLKKGIVGSYPRLKELDRWYDSLAKQYHFMSVFSIGATHEKRDIKVVKIAKRSGLPIVLVVCGTHAREWISVASCVWHINELLTSSDPSIQEVVEKVEFQIVPCHNPDGYEWTHVGGRLWRKNRFPNKGGCKGVDLNRNWDWRFGTESVGPECTELYPGTEPFSELETKALSEHMLREKNRMKTFIEFHSYGQKFLMPPGIGPKPPDFDMLQKIGKEAVRKMHQIAGRVYDAGAPADVLYPFSGGALDWSHNSLKGPGLKYSFAVELPPAWDSEVGFELPAREIPQAAKEAFAALKHVAQVVMEKNTSE